MPYPPQLVLAALVALGLIYGVHKTVVVVAKAGKEIGCIVKTGHKCAPKPEAKK